MNRQFARIAAMFGSAVFVFTGACGPTIRTAVEMRHEMTAQQSEPIAQDGLVVQARVLGIKEATEEPRLSKKVAFNAIDRQSGRTAPGEVGWLIATPPVFQVKVTNNTGHVVRFSGSIIKLVDAAGNMYDPATKDLLLATNNESISAWARERSQRSGATIAFPDQQMDGSTATVKAAIAGLKLLDANTELLPGMTETYFVAFQIPIEASVPSSYDDWLNKQTTLVLKMYEVTAETDAAGTPTKKVQFDFPVIVKNFNDSVTYTDGVRKVTSSTEIAAN